MSLQTAQFCFFMWSGNPTPEHIPRENHNSKRHMHPDVHSSTRNFWYHLKRGSYCLPAHGSLSSWCTRGLAGSKTPFWDDTKSYDCILRLGFLMLALPHKHFMRIKWDHVCQQHRSVRLCHHCHCHPCPSEHTLTLCFERYPLHSPRSNVLGSFCRHSLGQTSMLTPWALCHMQNRNDLCECSMWWH